MSRSATVLRLAVARRDSACASNAELANARDKLRRLLEIDFDINFGGILSRFEDQVKQIAHAEREEADEKCLSLFNGEVTQNPRVRTQKYERCPGKAGCFVGR